MGRLVFIASTDLLLTACGNRTPTGESAALPAPSAPASLQTTSPLSSSTATFDCSQLEEVRVRFSDPGFLDLDHLRVGLYVQYVGVPPGPKRLRIGSRADGLGTVWTCTLPNGDAASFPLGPDCAGWTSSSSTAFGTNGQHQGNLELWSFLGASSCNARLRLYCFQQ